MGADKLSMYNNALGHLLERKLASLSEDRKPRRVLDDFYPGTIAYCLEREPWNFAFRAVELDASSAVTPSFGFLYAFQIPSDWVRTHLLSSVPTFSPPLTDLREEGGWWYGNFTPLYVQYVSNDPTYGMDLGKWPQSFIDYVELRLARQACKRITGKDELLRGPGGLIDQETKARRVAAAICAMNNPVGFPPQSSWVRARRGFSAQMPGPGGDSPTGSSLVP
jgi:hypothetical protein